MLRFHCVALSEQSCDLTMDQGVIANVERRIVTDHLQNTVSFSGEG
jgi:hypothetical protein